MLYLANFGDPAEGYAQAALQYAMALQQTGYQQFRLMPVQGMINYRLLPSWCEPLSIPRDEGADVASLAVIHHLPSAMLHDSLLRGRRNVLLTVTETDAIPCWLADAMNRRLTAVIVPTEWNAQVFRESGVTCPIHVLPHTQGPYFKALVDRQSAHRAPGSRPWTFCYVGTWMVRKNPEGVLRGYLRAFPDPYRSDTRLVMKLSRSSVPLELISDIVADEMGSSARLEQDVQIITEHLTDEQLAYVHAESDCYVSAHLGEGWGIGSFQSALVGRRQIATRWSAPAEYLPDTMTDWVDHTMASAAPWAGAYPFYQNAALMCANPKMDSLIAAYQRSAAERRAVDAADVQSLWDTYGWETVGRRFVQIVKQIEAE